MVSETGKPKHKNGLDKSSEEFFEKRRNIVETYQIIGLIVLIASIILLSFNLNLIAGCLIVAGASLGIITFRKTSAENRKIRESLQNFYLLNEKKDNVIKDFSHKIREPLNNLVIVVDMLHESGLQKKQNELLETLIASTNNMVTILNDLTMQSAGNLRYEQRNSIRFNLISTIQNTIELFSLKEKRSIEFIFINNDSTEFECLGDPIIIKQIFLDLFTSVELIFNGKPTKITINLKKTRSSDSKSMIDLRIQTDSNTPIFSQADQEQSQAAKLIVSVGGSFSQESGGESTILNIRLPFNNPVDEPKEQIGSSKIAELISKEKTTKELKDLKVLLVEDNLINQKITLLTLKPLVYSIDTASNGKEALDKFGTANYDLILMDIQMPVMSGLTAAEKIRALESTTNSHIPIIAITANAMIGDKEKCLSAGIDDYISKPFQPAALIEKIKRNI